MREPIGRQESENVFRSSTVEVAVTAFHGRAHDCHFEHRLECRNSRRICVTTLHTICFDAATVDYAVTEIRQTPAPFLVL